MIRTMSRQYLWGPSSIDVQQARHAHFEPLMNFVAGFPPRLAQAIATGKQGGKRHIVTDTFGNLPEGLVHPVDVQDRDGAPSLLEHCWDAWPALVRFFVDGRYAAQRLKTAIAHFDRLAIEIIKRSDARCFVVLPRRWAEPAKQVRAMRSIVGRQAEGVERTIAWLNRCRRLANDWEASIAPSEAWLVIASIRRMTRRIAKLEL